MAGENSALRRARGKAGRMSYVDIEGVHPLHSLLYSVERLRSQVLIRDEPSAARCSQAEEAEVHTDEEADDADHGGALQLQRQTVGDCGHAEEKYQHHYEGWVVPSPLVFGLLPVRRELVHLAR
eukprot:CAMPEP_0177224806 /NCGR_PEP_ID=MMETSP0367-20130122/39219_1 /TAXON_ID=447022 ORGANISM="Scrippsiella hangoei-like, Strain SHHI-4" /NCGR_SAMPLE_ID=MMETSP0367 /ASSEMBLY_ACC=CAM_ASM_000362 /LENGTH=123 /DNA_ID=CAMNT_0018674877 /DNA_START=309 /DNA_END=681 /DNA_ORIENTATION=-